MLAGAVVKVPRGGRAVCAGCGRVLRWVSLVALDVPCGGSVLVCPRCYAAEPIGLWRGFPWLWVGDRWLVNDDDAVTVFLRESLSNTIF